jgi:hypothetical protein
LIVKENTQAARFLRPGFGDAGALVASVPARYHPSPVWLSGPVEVEMKNAVLLSRLSLSIVSVTMFTGCMMDPPGPSPIYSRLPSAQTQSAQPMTKEEQDRYNQIDRQALADQQQAMAVDAAAQAASQYYRAPVSLYGGYSTGGWGGSGWGIGTGYSW